MFRRYKEDSNLLLMLLQHWDDIVTDCWADTVPPHPPVIVYIMLHVPAEIPVTDPAALTVATAGLLLLHAPVPPPRTTPLAV